MDTLDGIMRATLANRTARIADNVTRNNALLRHIQSLPRPKPTLIQRMRRKVWHAREVVGFWIAGYRPDDA